jgi:23S rRNA (cytosine1962-C5)-methyltransferase
MRTVRLKAGHVQPVWAGHPWVYAQAIEWIEGGAAAGDEVSVVDPRGNFLGRGLYSPGSAIPVRILVRDATTHIDGAFVRAQIDRAVAMRHAIGLPNEDTTGYRLIHAEGDGLPGLMVDRFGDVLVVQLLTVGMKQREGIIFEALTEKLAPRAILDRTPESTARAEGFAVQRGVVRGEDVSELTFKERGLAYRIPMELGQKTGFYFDQRPLRARVEHLARGKRVLDAYSYVGPFAMAAARGGAASVLAVDESAIAAEVGAECARANGLGERIVHTKQDARKALVHAGAEGGYDLVVVDPPRVLVFCSCSAAVDLFALTRAMATGARRANVQAIVLERWFQGADHPSPAAFPEGVYLKSLIVRIEPR